MRTCFENAIKDELSLRDESNRIFKQNHNYYLSKLQSVVSGLSAAKIMKGLVVLLLRFLEPFSSKCQFSFRRTRDDIC